MHPLHVRSHFLTVAGDEPEICAAPDKSNGRKCTEAQKCRPDWEGPNDGITNFDNVFLSMLTVFQVITNEGWTDIMYWVRPLNAVMWCVICFREIRSILSNMRAFSCI